MKTIIAFVRALITRARPRRPAESILGRCYVPVQESCRAEVHIHGGAGFRRMFRAEATSAEALASIGLARTGQVGGV